MTEPLRLYTFSISHFSEKIRWTLGLEKIPFEEVPWTPPFHVVSARMSGPATTVPVIESGRSRVQDSTRILHWLDTNRGPLSLLPRDEATRQAVLDTEHRFDEIGGDVIRLAYAHVLPDTDAVVKLWTIDATPLQARAVRAGFPLFRVLFRRRLDTSDARLAASRERLESGLDLIAQRTTTHPFLVGDRLSIADVAAASLLAPLVCPDEHPVYASAAYRAGISPVAERWASHPAFAWVRRTYREHRGAWPRAAHVTGKLAS
jgi:glutathione S-transferase